MIITKRGGVEAAVGCLYPPVTSIKVEQVFTDSYALKDASAVSSSEAELVGVEADQEKRSCKLPCTRNARNEGCSGLRPRL